jgi:hypothetical protein
MVINTVDAKRSMKGVYQFCAEKHLHRSIAEFDFRYNHRSKLGYGDTDHTVAAIRITEGKASCTVNLVRPPFQF